MTRNSRKARKIRGWLPDLGCQNHDPYAGVRQKAVLSQSKGTGLRTRDLHIYVPYIVSQFKIYSRWFLEQHGMHLVCEAHAVLANAPRR